MYIFQISDNNFFSGLLSTYSIVNYCALKHLNISEWDGGRERSEINNNRFIDNIIKHVTCSSFNGIIRDIMML